MTDQAVAPLYISYRSDDDALEAAEFGAVVDGAGPDNWRPLSENFAYLLRSSNGPEIGFQATNFSRMDPEAELEEAFSGPRFHVPVLGLRDAAAGEILLAADSFFEGEATLNRELFDAAVEVSGEEAVEAWRRCLQAGDLMAHYGLGYTLYDLGQYRVAYRHLRYYAEINPTQAWSWCYLGKAAEALGELVEARDHYRRAVATEEETGEETDAGDLLSSLATRSSSQTSDAPAGKADDDRPGNKPNPKADSGARFVVDTPFDSLYLQEVDLSAVGNAEPRPVALFLAGGPMGNPLSVAKHLIEQSDAFVPAQAVFVSPSEIRKQLPEFNPAVEARDPGAAAIVKDESEDVAGQLVEQAAAAGLNLMVEGMGAGEPGQFARVLEKFNAAGYEVRVLLADVSIVTALERNENRAAETGLRYDPNVIRELHRDVSQRSDEWMELPFVASRLYSTEAKT